MMYFTVVVTAVYAVFDALNPVLGQDAVATGYVPSSAVALGRRDDGLEGTLSAGAGPTILGPWGATKHGDADSTQQGILSNLMNAGVEIYELTAPALWLMSEYMPDTAGAGTHRGGASNVHDVMWRRTADHAMQLLFHSRRPSAKGGVWGGRPGPTTAAWLFDGEISDFGQVVPELPLSLHDHLYRRATPLGGLVDGETNEVVTEGPTIYHPGGGHVAGSAGAVTRTVTTAGGGWGDPLGRDPERVKVDVRDGYVSFEGAARDYGVVITGDLDHPEQLEVDQAATTELRNRRRASASTTP